MEFLTYLNVLIVLLFGLIWIGIVTFLRLKGQKSFAYLTFFTIFYAYIVEVLDYTLIQFQSLLLLKYFKPGLILQGQAAGKSLNLIPLITLTPGQLRRAVCPLPIGACRRCRHSSTWWSMAAGLPQSGARGSK